MAQLAGSAGAVLKSRQVLGQPCLLQRGEHLNSFFCGAST